MYLAQYCAYLNKTSLNTDEGNFSLLEISSHSETIMIVMYIRWLLESGKLLLLIYKHTYVRVFSYGLQTLCHEELRILTCSNIVATMQQTSRLHQFRKFLIKK